MQLRGLLALTAARATVAPAVREVGVHLVVGVTVRAVRAVAWQRVALVAEALTLALQAEAASLVSDSVHLVIRMACRAVRLGDVVIGAMVALVEHVLTVRPVNEIARGAISGIPVKVPHFLARRARADECERDKLVNAEALLSAITGQRDMRISALVGVLAQQAATRGRSWGAQYLPVVRYLVKTLVAGYRQPFSHLEILSHIYYGVAA